MAASWSTWVSDDNGVDYDIRGRVFDATGNALPGGDFLVSTTNAGDQAFFPQIAALSNGGFVVTWPSIDGRIAERGRPRPRVRCRGRSGHVGGSTDDFLIPTSNNSAQFNPRITALAGGGFAVTWESNANSGQTDIHGRVFDAAGNPVNASDFAVSTTNTDYQANPHITALANGGFAITWSSDDGGTRDIRGRVFDADRQSGQRKRLPGLDHECVRSVRSADHRAGEWRLRGDVAIPRQQREL